MIDLKQLQNNFDDVSSRLQRKGVDTELIHAIQEKSRALKAAKAAFEKAQAAQNEMSKLFGQYKREGKDVGELKAKVDANKLRINELIEKQRDAEEALRHTVMGVPNLPDDEVPDGSDESDNVELCKVLTPRTFTFTPKEHWELAEQNGWIDFERGVKIAKSRFAVVCDEGARLERALINFMLDFNRQRGFTEVSVPAIVNRTALEGTGQLPKFEEDLYKIEDEPLYLIPTAEVPLTNLFQDEILPA